MLCTHEILFGSQTKTTEMGRACSTWGRGELHTGFWWGNLREGDHLEDPDIHRRIILKWIFGKWDGWRGLDRSSSGKGQVAVVNAVMNL
jgi:hypothetical protein